MSISLNAVSTTQCKYLALLDTLLAVDWTQGETVKSQQINGELDGIGIHLVANESRIVEATIDLPDEEREFVDALSWHFGTGMEISTMHSRLHRWLVGGHEVLLSARHDAAPTLAVA